MVVAKARIGDFERFWETFSTRGAAKRAEHGSRGARVFRNADDPNEIITIFEWDRAGFEAFMADPEAPEIMAAAGLEGRPEPTYVEQIDLLPS
jgi:quinol monooxygenase YgiN